MTQHEANISQASFPRSAGGSEGCSISTWLELFVVSRLRLEGTTESEMERSSVEIRHSVSIVE